MNTTLVSCPICDSSLDSEINIDVKDPFAVTDEVFKIENCPSCRTWVLNPRPDLEAMQKFYAEGFLKEQKEKVNKSFIDHLANQVQQFNLVSELSWINEYKETGSKYLDYSAGNGQIAEEFSNENKDHEVYVTDFSDYNLKSLELKFDKNRVGRSLDDFNSDLKFDMISAFGVLEHVDNPRELLKQFSSKLNMGGKLLLSVPNPDSFQAKVFGNKWYSWLAPRHWQLITKDYLKELLANNGFEVIGEKNFFMRTSSASIVLSLFPSLDPLNAGSKFKLIAYAILFYLFIPVELVVSLFGKGAFMGVTCRKVSK